MTLERLRTWQRFAFRSRISQGRRDHKNGDQRNGLPQAQTQNAGEGSSMSETSAPTIAFEEPMPRLPVVWNNHSMAWISDRIAGIVHSDGKAETDLVRTLFPTDPDERNRETRNRHRQEARLQPVQHAPVRNRAGKQRRICRRPIRANLRIKHLVFGSKTIPRARARPD